MTNGNGNGFGSLPVKIFAGAIVTLLVAGIIGVFNLSRTQLLHSKDITHTREIIDKNEASLNLLTASRNDYIKETSTTLESLKGDLRRLIEDTKNIQRDLDLFMLPGERYTEENANLLEARLRAWFSSKKIPPDEVVDALENLKSRVNILEFRISDENRLYLIRRAAAHEEAQE